MKKYTYQETRDDVISIVNSEINRGNSISGGLGRAEVEYWLGPLELSESKPTPYALKLLAAVSIASIRRENSLNMEDLNNIIEWLLCNSTTADYLVIEQTSLSILVHEVSQLFGKELANKIKLEAA